MLTRAKITDAALRLVARRGAQGFTLAALASELKVSTSALYNHAASKATVFRWMQDAVNRGIDVNAFGEHPLGEALRAWARSYREAYVPYPMLVPVMALQPVTDAPETVAMYERVVAAFVAEGWSDAEALNAVVALESFIFGAALDTAAPDDIFDVEPSSADAPRLASAVRARADRHGRGREAADAAFDLGLDALVHGLTTR